MQAFTLYTPTEIVFGKGAEEQIATQIKKHGGTRVFIIYGGGSVVKSGLLEKTENQLKDAGIPFTSLGGAQPNPLLSFAKDAIQLAIEFNADFILALGGGSAIDTGKAIAHGVKNPDTDIWKFWNLEEPLTKTLPVGVVLTISAAGSETSNSAVLTNTEIGQKRGLSTDFNRPKFAIMNPEYTYTLPKYQITCGVVDIIMHTLERYFTMENGNEFTDEIAEALMRVTIKNGQIALADPTNYDAMSELMWCGSISHNGITGLGRAADFSVHQIGHEISAKFDAAHGAALSATWGSWALYCYHQNPERFARFAKQVWGIEHADPNEAATLGISKTVDYFKSLEMPTCFTELGIGVLKEEDLEEMADRCVYRGKRLVGSFKKLNKDDIYNILKMANR